MAAPVSSAVSVQYTTLAKANEKGFITNVFRVRHGRVELVELKLKEALGSRDGPRASRTLQRQLFCWRGENQGR